MRPALIAAIGALAVPSLADWIYEQPWDGVTGGRLSTAYSDAPNFSTYQFDNFHISDPHGDVTAIAIYGRETGNSFADIEYGLRIQSAPGWNAGTLIYEAHIRPGSGTYLNGNLMFSFGGLFLPIGDYYLTAWVQRPTGHGDWLWRATTPVIGGEAIYHNPGGGQGFGTNPIPGSTVYGQARDMAFRIESLLVPEPASFAALMLGLPLIWRRRRR